MVGEANGIGREDVDDERAKSNGHHIASDSLQHGRVTAII